MGGASWVLDMDLDAVLEVVAAGNVGVGGCDLAGKWQGSGCEKGGWVLGCGLGASGAVSEELRVGLGQGKG